MPLPELSPPQPRDANDSVATDVSLLEKELRPSFVQMVVNTLGGERTSSFTENDKELGFAFGAKPANDEPILPISSQIGGRFTVQKAIGRGGFGTVYLAHDEALDREVAIKVPHEKLRSDPQLSSQCLKEARLAAKLRHPSIVTIFDISEEKGCIAHIVQEYVQGATLYELISKQRFSVKQTILTIMKVAEAVAFAHSRGVYHRDLKPANLMIDESGGIRVLDFGLAVDEEMQRTSHGQIAGTLAYMSPEQIEGRTHHLDGRTDIWSLGVIFYELLTGRRPFRGNANEITDQVTKREAPPPRQFIPSIPKSVEACCLKCLSKSVSNRYATALDLLEDLKEIIENETLLEELPNGPLPGTPRPDSKRSAKEFTQSRSNPFRSYFPTGSWIWVGIVAIVGILIAYQFAPTILAKLRGGQGEKKARTFDPLPPGVKQPWEMEPKHEQKILQESEFIELIAPQRDLNQPEKKATGLSICASAHEHAGVFAEIVGVPNYGLVVGVTPTQRWQGKLSVLIGMKKSNKSDNVWLGNAVEIYQETDEAWCIRYKFLVIENGVIRHESPLSDVYKLQKDPTFSEEIEIQIADNRLYSVKFAGKDYTKIGIASNAKALSPKSMGEYHGVRTENVTGQFGIYCAEGCYDVTKVFLWKY